MCGICGIVLADGQQTLAKSDLERMRDTLVHRGPDGFGAYLDAGVALGHRRLSIVDVEHGQQPMYSADERFVIVYNGEVFNHPQIKASLESEGVVYNTRSDTESVLHLFEKYGEQSVEHMRGMFAIAIWDRAEQSLFLARDRFGVKPLYYLVRDDGSLLFASEMKAILAASSEAPELNIAAMPDFLANHAPSGDETLFSRIRRLPAGHTLSWKAGKLTIRQYWDLKYPVPAPAPARRSAAEHAVVTEFRDRFTEAVRIRLMSDVPLGMFLSGGIDSAAITATMSELVKDPIQTFSVAFSEREANELRYARLVSAEFGTKHHEVVVSPEEFFSKLPQLVWHEDEPIAHPSSVALYFVSVLAAAHVKVVLTGEGSDELLGGYNRYRITEYNAKLGRKYDQVVPARLRHAARSAIRFLPRHGRIRQKLDRTFLMRGSELDDLYFDNFAVFGREAQRGLCTKSLREATRGIDPYAAYHAALAHVAGRPLLSQLLYADAKTYLQELLMKQDQMSMAASIESRTPFLDHPLAEWVAALPQSFKLRGTTTKWILRAAMRGRLPDEILDRRKMGFPVPVGAWFRGAWRPMLEAHICGERASERNLFDASTVRQLVSEHASGVNHSERLWALLNFEIWARIFLDGEVPEALSASPGLPIRSAA